MKDVKIVHTPVKPERHQHAVHQLVFGVAGQSMFNVESGFSASVDIEHACVLTSHVEYELSGEKESEVLVIQINEGDDVLNNDEHPDYGVFKQFFDNSRCFTLDDSMQRLVRLFVSEISLAPADNAFRQAMGYSLIRCLSNRAV